VVRGRGRMMARRRGHVVGARGIVRGRRAVPGVIVGMARAVGV